MSEIKRYIVAPDEDGIRLDRWFKIHFPQVTFAYLNKLTRTGQMRVQGGRAKTSTRAARRPGNPGSPVDFDRRPADIPKGDVQPLTKDETSLFESMIIFEDKDLYVLNKPPGFAVQGGSKTFQHLDGLLMGLAKRIRRKTLACSPAGPGYVRRYRRCQKALDCVRAWQTLCYKGREENLLGRGQRHTKTATGPN